MTPGTVAHIFVAAARGEPMTSLEEAEAIAGRGLSGDRYADPGNRSSPGGQVTLIELEHIEAFSRELGLPLAPDGPRRNLVTRGVRLNGLVGERFRVGEVQLEGMKLCEPCRLFAERTHSEVLKFFVHKGGLRARIVEGGTIRLGDPVGAGDCDPTGSGSA